MFQKMADAALVPLLIARPRTDEYMHRDRLCPLCRSSNDGKARTEHIDGKHNGRRTEMAASVEERYVRRQQV